MQRSAAACISLSVPAVIRRPFHPIETKRLNRLNTLRDERPRAAHAGLAFFREPACSEKKASGRGEWKELGSVARRGDCSRCCMACREGARSGPRRCFWESRGVAAVGDRWPHARPSLRLWNGLGHR
jgi:hypothetical protein